MLRLGLTEEVVPLDPTLVSEGHARAILAHVHKLALQELDCRPVTELLLSQRAINVLHRAKLKNCGQVYRWIAANRYLPGAGGMTYREIRHEFNLPDSEPTEGRMRHIRKSCSR